MFKQRSSNIILLLTIMLLYGCISPYIPPVEGNTGALLFVNKTDYEIAVYGFEEASNCSGLLTFGQSSHIEPFSQQEVLIASEKPLSFMYSFAIGSFYCHMIAILTPQLDKNYVVNLDADFYNCYIDLYINDDGKSVAEPTFKIKKTYVPFFSTGAFCEN